VQSKTKAAARGDRLFSNSRNLVQPEAHFHVNRYCHRLSIFHRRIKAPVLHRFNRLLVEAHSKLASDANIARLAIGTDYQHQDTNTLILRLASFFRILRIWSRDCARGGNSTANAEYAAADTSST